jgi:dTDP-4-amino-4,6-dideoxygalactose transaminase
MNAPLVSNNDEDILFFSTGRAALKFILQVLSSKKTTPVSIAMQSFNCHVVIDAAMESGCQIYLFDIKLNDFSISYKDLSRSNHQIDVLVLTHYQGIPNVEYEKIVEYCKINSILLIEDLAQAHESKINGVKIGSLGNLCITSYAFDKPFSCFQGGGLIINDVTNNLREDIYQKYSLIDTEKLNHAKLDIRLLKFLYYNSTPEKYHLGINIYPFIRSLLSVNIPPGIIYYIMYLFTIPFFRNAYSKFMNYVLVRLNRKIAILKLNEIKIHLIKLQWENYEYRDNTKWIKSIINDGIDPFINYNVEIHWNRYSVLDPGQKIRTKLKQYRIESGNFNWPISLHERYGKFVNVKAVGSLSNCEYASENVINIPVWFKNDQSREI